MARPATCCAQLLLIAVVFVFSSSGWADELPTEGPKPGAYLRTWQLCGPFYAEVEGEVDMESWRRTALQRDWLADAGGEAASEALRGDAWKAITSADDAVSLPMGEESGPAVWYAQCAWESENAAEWTLEISGNSSQLVWLNGGVIHLVEGQRIFSRPGDLVRLPVKVGTNVLRIKNLHPEGKAKFACRFLNDEERDRELVKAAAQRNVERLKDLLSAGADVNGTNRFGLTALQVARIEGNDQIAKLLPVLGAREEAFEPAPFVHRVLHAEDAEDADADSSAPGAALLVARDADVLLAEAVGMADLAHGIHVTTDTKFRIGSVTKQFTAAAILKLQEDGQLKVTDTLEKYYPEFPRGEEVTLHHLLTHTSGLKNYTSRPDFLESVASASSAEDLIKQFHEDGFESEPGEKFAYCNTGYFLLGEIVAQVSGQSFADYLKATFFEPLQMHDTGVHVSTEIYPHEARGYASQGDEVSKAINWDMSRAGGAGNLYSTVHDLHRWNQAVFAGQVLGEASLDQAHQVHVKQGGGGVEMPYGYGWMMDEFRGQRRISHSGGLHGFVSQLSYFPELKVTVVALHNALPSVPERTPQVLCDLATKAFFFKDLAARPKYEVDADFDVATLDDYVGRYDYMTAVLEVSRDGDRLMAQLTGQPKFEIFPSGGDRFFWKVVDAQMEFQRDPVGAVVAARHSQGLQKFTAARLAEIETVPLSDEVLERYVGTYDYGAVGKLTIRREEKRLFAQMTGQAEFELFPKTETELMWKAIPARLVFTVDEAGNIRQVVHHQAGREMDVKKVP